MREELKHRMLKHLTFLEVEMKDYSKFKKLTWLDYTTDADKRRSVERWTENIINSSIDISKNILTLEGINLPDNYKEFEHWDALSDETLQNFEKSLQRLT